MKSLRYLNLMAVAALLVGSASLASAENSAVVPVVTQSRAEKQIQHNLMMLPYFTPFDDVKFALNGDTVTLTGAVLTEQRKKDAEWAVKQVESVAKVNDQIEVLPASFFDDRLRIALARAIYGYGPLERYDLGTVAPIRIIVKNGHATLEGVVANQMDKILVNMRANQVPGLFSVTNDLEVGS